MKVNKRGMGMIKEINRIEIGDIVWVNFEGKGHIQSGARPAIVIQNNKGNIFSPTIQVVPLTSKLNKAKLPTHTIIENNEKTGLRKRSVAQCEGVRLIMKVDIIGKLGKVDDETMKRVAECLFVNNPLLIYFTGNELLNLRTVLCQNNQIA